MTARFATPDLPSTPSNLGPQLTFRIARDYPDETETVPFLLLLSNNPPHPQSANYVIGEN
jgi:hypothetical protein